MNDSVIITGHTRGLGFALANAWLECGADVLCAARSANHTLAQAYPDNFQQSRVDLSNPVAVSDWIDSLPFRRFCNQAERLWLFNNAGTVAPSEPLGSQDTMKIALAVNLNVTTPLMLSNAVSRLARRSEQVNIVHISSGAGRKDYPGWSVYGASKAALDRHASVVNSEEQQLRIVSLAPGVVDTQMQENIRNNPRFPLHEHFSGIHGQGLLQSPEETAIKIVSYCLSDAFAGQPIADIRSIDKII